MNGVVAGESGGLRVRRAEPADALKIINLYQDIYEGTYPDPLMSHYRLLKDTLASHEYCWMVAESPESGAGLVGAVVYRVDASNRLAKVFGAAVRPEYRGHNLTERLMDEGREALARAGQ